MWNMERNEPPMTLKTTAPHLRRQKLVHVTLAPQKSSLVAFLETIVFFIHEQAVIVLLEEAKLAKSDQTPIHMRLTDAGHCHPTPH